MTKNTMQNNVSASPSEVGSVSRGSLALTNIPKPTPAISPFASTKNMFKLFMQIYMNTVQNQA